MTLKTPAPRRRGRPLGAKTRVLMDADLGIHHFAFVRAWLQGLDSRWAWDRYVAFAEAKSDLRHIEHRRKMILAQILSLGHKLNLTLPDELKITSLLNVLSREPVIAPAKVLPSLDEFVQLQDLDPDMYSEAELIEIYQEHYAGGPADEPSDSSEHVKALNKLAALLAVPPSPSDPLSRWFEPALAAKIQASGAVNLASLIDLINVYGHNWFKRIPHLGAERAGRIVAWLVSIEHPALLLRESALQPPLRSAVERLIDARDVVVSREFGLVPLDRLDVPSSTLLGANGLFRTNMPNTLGARNDFEAILGWLKKYEERPTTLRSYKKDVERFYLWCLLEAKKPLSSIDSGDAINYRKFLAKLPSTWISSPSASRGTPDWRPFRGQLDPATQKLALVIIQAMFEGLRDAGYLVANPFKLVMKGFNLPQPRINVDRSFTAREWDYLMRRATGEPPSPTQRRQVLMLELLVAMGLRLDEIATARISNLKRVEVRGDDDAWILVVTGKRRKQREVPMPDYVIDLIEAHHADLDDLPNDPFLLAPVGRAVQKWRMVDGEVQLREPEGDGGLSAAGVYAALKRFFERAARTCDDPSIDVERLRKASTHWLRHTFGRQAAADEVPIEVIQQALGHTSLSTTTIYTSTERDRMISALRRRKREAKREA